MSVLSWTFSKILYENANKNRNKHDAEIIKPLIYPIQLFADLENLVRLPFKIELIRKLWLKF